MITRFAPMLLDRIANIVLGSLARAVRLAPDSCSTQILADLSWSALVPRPAAIGPALHAMPSTCAQAA